jgi:hypothetical protein
MLKEPGSRVVCQVETGIPAGLADRGMHEDWVWGTSPVSSFSRAESRGRRWSRLLKESSPRPAGRYYAGSSRSLKVPCESYGAYWASGPCALEGSQAGVASRPSHAPSVRVRGQSALGRGGRFRAMIGAKPDEAELAPPAR